MAVLAQVIPLRRGENPARIPVTAAGEPPSATEPAQLYGLAGLALTLHRPTRIVPSFCSSPSFGVCRQCGKQWPCPQVRLVLGSGKAFEMSEPNENPIARAAAYGYILAEEPNEDQISDLRKEIGAFCRREALHLVTVFCDRGYDGSETARPGFAAALDALALPDSAALVVPTEGHVSPNDTVREGLLRQVKRTGANVLMVRGSNRAVPGTGCPDTGGITDHGGEPK